MRKQIRLAIVALALVTAPAAWSKTEMLVVSETGVETPVTLNTDTKVTFTASGVTALNGSAEKVFPYAKVSKIRFKTPTSGLPELTVERVPFGLRENPVQEALRITGDIQLPAQVAVTALDGKTVASFPEWNGQDIDVSYLQPGIYLLTVNNKTLKFIKK